MKSVSNELYKKETNTNEAETNKPIKKATLTIKTVTPPPNRINVLSNLTKTNTINRVPIQSHDVIHEKSEDYDWGLRYSDKKVFNNSFCEDNQPIGMLQLLKQYLMSQQMEDETDDQHVVANKQSLSSMFKCANCKLLFVDSRLLNEHLNECSVLNTTLMSNRFGNEEAVIDDMNRFSSGKVFFKCKHCKEVYSNKLSYMSHAIMCTGSANY